MHENKHSWEGATILSNRAIDGQSLSWSFVYVPQSNHTL